MKIRRFIAAAGALALAACGALPPPLAEDPARELTEVPFYPQTLHQCGPAALATVLGWSGVATTPETLASQVYIPGREGSLAVELIGATRRAGRIPYQLPQRPEAIRAELEAGTPVLVLQDLGAAWIEVWHFAVVIGFDAPADAFILRSGTERRRIEPAARFMRSWERAGRWAMVALPPEKLPSSLAPDEVVRAIEAAAQFLPPGSAQTAYAAAATRWPGDPLVLFAAANSAYAAGELSGADRHYRRLLQQSPDHGVARNNFANLLLDRGCFELAKAQAADAVARLEAQPDALPAHRAAAQETLDRARQLACADAAPAAPEACAPLP